MIDRFDAKTIFKLKLNIIFLILARFIYLKPHP